MELRGYQSEAIDAVFAYWREHKGRFPLIVLPTGAGKTYTTVALLRRLVRDFAPIRILILAHRRELLTQFERSIFNIWESAPVGVYCAGLGRKEISTITIASRDSLRANTVNALGRFDLVIIDEAHNVDHRREETQYMRIIRKVRKRNPAAMVLGLTATPFRDQGGYIYGDEHLFAGVAYEVRLRWMIDNGYLVRPVSKQVAAEINTVGLRTVAGDFNNRELDARASHLETVRGCLDEWQRLALAQGRASTLFFAVSINHALLIATELAERGIDCRLVTGETPQDERDRVLDEFTRGEVPALVNVGVMTEGTDIPPIDCIALLRPTRSLKLFIQMVGRGLRLHPGKTDCLLLDFGGNLQRFGPVDIAEPMSKRQDPRTKVCPDCSTVVGLHKRNCPECKYEFTPPPFKVCPDCGEENAPGRRECVACGYEWPLELDTRASTDAALSDDIEPIIRAFDVQDIIVAAKISGRSGNEYLRITYVCGLLNRFHKNLMIGYGGYAGRKAEIELRALMGRNADYGVPRTPTEAVALHRDGWLLRPVSRIHVNVASKYQEITTVFIEGR